MPGLPSPSAKSASELTIAMFQDLTSHAAHAQESLLASILQDNASCEYLQQFAVHKHMDALSFTQSVPLVTHADIRPFLHRIAEGERTSILTAAPIEALCLSSGTTGAQEKYLPFHEGLQHGTLEVARLAAAFRARAYATSAGARILEFLFCGKFNTTRGGLQVGTASTHMIRTGVFRQRQTDNGFKPCSPQQVVLGCDCRQVMYCHLLCGLIYSGEVEVMSAPFAFTVVEALRMLEAEWEWLCEDIKTGTLNASKVTEDSLRAAMAEILRPNAKLAEEVYAKCRRLGRERGWRGVVEALWPQCKYVLSIMTGAMEAYTEKLQLYAGPRIPLVSADYAATEGWVGVNVEPASSPSTVSFTVMPTLAFFEFIPLYPSKELVAPATGSHSAVYEEGHPVRLTDVEIGQEYEIVMTTRWGLYRYRLGDIVRVTSFCNATPQLTYMCRKNVMLNINIDKTTEKDLKAVMTKATKHLADMSGDTLELVDYTSYADCREMPGHYVIFWEVDIIHRQNNMANYENTGNNLQLQGNYENFVSKEQSELWFAQCATLMDCAFVEPGYVTSRKMNNIGALELCIVQSGTFSKLLDCFLSRGAAITQYKTPRCIISHDALSILNENISIKLISTATF